MRSLEKLASIASEALGPPPSVAPAEFESYASGGELFESLEVKNGFYAFEQALHIFPLGADTTGTMTLEEWNSKTLWRSAYQDLANGLLFFGEDIFGDQFCLSSAAPGVFRFEAETGRSFQLANSVEEWAENILNDYPAETGWPLAHNWQTDHGPLPLGTRLQPKIPFVYGGEYSIDNLWVGDATAGMLFKAEIAMKIRDLPDGTRIRLEVKRDQDPKSQ